MRCEVPRSSKTGKFGNTPKLHFYTSSPEMRLAPSGISMEIPWKFHFYFQTTFVQVMWKLDVEVAALASPTGA